MRLPQEMLERIDKRAARAGESRAETVRAILAWGLSGGVTPCPLPWQARDFKVVVIEAGDEHTDRLNTLYVRLVGDDEDVIDGAANAVSRKGYRVMGNDEGGCCEYVRPDGDQDDYIAITVYPQ